MTSLHRRPRSDVPTSLPTSLRGRGAGARAWPLLAAALLLAVAGNVGAESITVAYKAKAITVVQKPFGLTVPLSTPVTGYFTFDTSATDDNPDDPLSGEYPHAGGSAFVADFLEHRITGSQAAFYWVDLSDDPSNDTFRVYDGPRTVGFEGGTMALDGAGDTDIQLFLAVTADAFDNDHLINPFPSYTFGFLGTPHTFTLKDEHGTMLMQLDSATTVVCGDPTGNGITASDALFALKASVGSASCLRCACDVDGNSLIAASDALKILKVSVNQPLPLACSPCV